jgi:hypothetical protein
MDNLKSRIKPLLSVGRLDVTVLVDSLDRRLFKIIKIVQILALYP